MPGVNGGFTNFGAGITFPAQCQYMADYMYGSNPGVTNTAAGNLTGTGYQQVIGTGVTEQR